MVEFSPQTSKAAGSNLGLGTSCWKVGSYLPMPGGLQCSVHWFPPPVNYPSQYDPGCWTRRKTPNKETTTIIALKVTIILGILSVCRPEKHQWDFYMISMSNSYSNRTFIVLNLHWVGNISRNNTIVIGKIKVRGQKQVCTMNWLIVWGFTSRSTARVILWRVVYRWRKPVHTAL